MNILTHIFVLYALIIGLIENIQCVPVYVEPPQHVSSNVATVDSSIINQEWNNFKTKFNKSYGSPEEELKRFEIFKDNYRKIEEHNNKFNKGEVSYTLKVNDFADKTSQEFQSERLAFGNRITGGFRPRLGFRPRNNYRVQYQY